MTLGPHPTRMELSHHLPIQSLGETTGTRQPGEDQEAKNLAVIAPPEVDIKPSVWMLGVLD